MGQYSDSRGQPRETWIMVQEAILYDYIFEKTGTANGFLEDLARKQYGTQPMLWRDFVEFHPEARKTADMFLDSRHLSEHELETWIIQWHRENRCKDGKISPGRYRAYTIRGVIYEILVNPQPVTIRATSCKANQ